MTRKHLLLTLIFLFTIAGCAPKEQAGQMDYEETKKMVVDILKTDDGKKAIEEIMNQDPLKQSLVMDQKTVSDTIEKTLTSEKGAEFWKKTFEDPKFAESFAKSLQTEHEKVIKDLMKDPDYQKMLIQVFQNPDMEKQMTTAVQGQEFRKHLQTVITETLSSPLYKNKMEETLLKAAKEMESAQGQGGGGGEQSSEQQGGGGGQQSGP
ncbi:spore germination lipoprotein GerD [Metabacillus arenae]|uniref:Spore gernimation protein GerD n=1 Tax=Metabacillus arenae TaxID=2771434 RepID=A0A926NRN2_9BACI|nr:spore germination lipoprotein GerD [Metabacillus arenae]MBD1382722.1 spore gernimation protein GerD [Metabacillus arenae]